MTALDLGPMLSTLAEVAEERARQEAMWGEQNHPDAVPGKAPLIMSAATTRAYCDLRHKRGEGSWLDILVEEVAEAAEEAASGNVSALREELVQVAAVAVAWVQAIDRRPGWS